MRRRNKIVIAIISLVAGFFYLDLIVPIHKACEKAYDCRLCGAWKSETTFYLWAFRIRKEMEGPQRTWPTELFDKYIAEPHQHEWVECGDHTSKWHIFEERVHLDWMGSSRPIFHYRLRRELLLAMELFKDEPVEFRREVYRYLIECKDQEDYERVRRLLEDMRADPGNARDLYDTYRARENGQSWRRGRHQHQQDPRTRPGRPRRPADLQMATLRHRPNGSRLFRPGCQSFHPQEAEVAP